MSASDGLDSWRNRKYLVSISHYAGDGLWYVIVKQSKEDIGVRCRSQRKEDAVNMMVGRLRLAHPGPLFGQEQLYR